MSAPFPDAPTSGGRPRLIILGAGALGSLFGAQLSGPLEVILVGRAAHMAAIQQHGLTLRRGAGLHAGRAGSHSAAGGERVLRMAAVQNIPNLRAHDRVGVFVKTRDTAAVGKLLALALGNLPPAAAATVEIWTFQNGIDNRETLQAALAAGLPTAARPPVYAAIANHGATLNAPGVITDYGGDYRFPDTPAGRALRDHTAAAGVVTHLTANIDAELWRKLALNCVVNPLTLLLTRRNRFILTPELAGLRRGIMREVEAVAAAEGVHLAADDLLAHMESAMAPSMNYSSMYQDWLRYQARKAADPAAQLKTEIANLTGAVIARGRRHSVPTPINQTLFRLVRFYETAGRA